MASSTTSTGRQAETAVANHLEKLGYEILDQNWRTQRCEIDIIAQKTKTAYFIEVKYRGSDRQGDGVDYITATKLKQMTFSAEVWVSQNNWDDDWQLLVASVSGDKFEAIELIPID